MSLTQKIRVLLADDHTLFSDGLAMQLTVENSPVEVVGQVFRGNDVLPAIQQHAPHVILLDINLPQQTGIVCAQQAMLAFPELHVVMLTMYGYRKFVDQCRSIGVAGYLLKHERAEVIIHTLKQVQAGQRCFPTDPTSNRHEADFFVRQFKLTPTELKIIGLIRTGLSSQQIADRLFISFETVRSHRKNIYRKLDITHLSELLNFASEYAL
ncbi:LuxR C-terminal-related transcriptional regulator [Spirosoma arcticum]